MLKISNIISALEALAPPSYQESYDNVGLLIGNASWSCTGIICTLDATEAVVEEAIEHGYNLIVAHHPILFTGLKKLTGATYVEQTIIKAIKNNIAIYAIHTNLDNILNGVNETIASRLNLVNKTILAPKQQQLLKLSTYVPIDFVEKVQAALFAAGAGEIGNYSQCSFRGEGIGTFKPDNDAKPFVGSANNLHQEKEIKLEVILPIYLQKKVLAALKNSHPYEEVAYNFIVLNNHNQFVGSGIVGDVEEAIDPLTFLAVLKQEFNLKVIKHTTLLPKQIKKIAICGGSGSFLISNAIAACADIFITSDVKYHEYFNAENKLIIADIGHWESEQFVPNLLKDFLQSKFPTFAVLKSSVNTNSVHYFLGND